MELFKLHLHMNLNNTKQSILL